MRFKRSREEDAGLGIAPLIDIVFLLLIFFMVTSRFDADRGIPVCLPKIENRADDRKRDRAVVALDKNGGIFLEGERLSMAALRERLGRLTAAEDPVGLILEADKDVRHGLVVQVMDAAKGAGIGDIFIAAR